MDTEKLPLDDVETRLIQTTPELRKFEKRMDAFWASFLAIAIIGAFLFSGKVLYGIMIEVGGAFQ